MAKRKKISAKTDSTPPRRTNNSLVSKDFFSKNITINEEEWNHIQEIIEASGELQDRVNYNVLIYDKYFKNYE